MTLEGLMAMADADSLALVDAALRGALVATLSLLGWALWKERSQHPVARVGLALMAGLAVQTFAATPVVDRGWPVVWQAPLVGVSVGNAALFWLFARAMFDDDFAIGKRHLALWAAVVAVGAAFCLSIAVFGPHALPTRVLVLALRWLPALFAALVIAAAVSQWRADLVERRRRLRGFIVVAGALYAATMVVLRLSAPHGRLSAGAAGFDTAVLLAITLVAALTLLRLGSDELLPRVVGVGSQALPQAAGDAHGASVAAIETLAADRVVAAGGGLPDALKETPGRSQVSLTPSGGLTRSGRFGGAHERSQADDIHRPSDAAEQRLAESLERLMAQERVYRIDDLTLGVLALKLDVPEYRLRRHINQRLGQRNFNAYVNGWRLAQAREALADPGQRDSGVLEIAMDAGFASIGPFNRAFKAALGVTPSEFRRRALADS